MVIEGNAPEFSDHTIAATSEGITDLHGKVTTDIVVRWAFFVLA